MSHSLLIELAERAGIAADYYGPDGHPVVTSDATRRRLLAGLGIPAEDEAAARAKLETLQHRALPRMAYHGEPACIPHWLWERPAWGITCQLYELRSERDWGIGDFEDLAVLAETAAAAGADFVGVTPLHALFLAAPQRCSPFSPSSRRFLNPLYIAVDRVPGYGAGLVADADLEAARQGGLIDYPRVAALKLRALSGLWRHWQADAKLSRPASLEAFEVFRRESGEALQRHALFEALSAQMAAGGHGAGWTAWPAEFHDPAGDAVAAFARDHADDVAFHAWLQWVADAQLAEAAARARRAGMRIGLYLDLAVGEVPDGSAVWADRKCYVGGATIGAPPDYFSASGQEWGIVAPSPLALAADDYAPLVDLVAGAARHAGALRIDHVMSLWQLFLIPDGLSAAEGAYVRFHVDEILKRLAALSRERGLVVVGEDLGYVPHGFRDVMHAAGILSYRIAYFEKGWDGRFQHADAYPRQALACLSTHDLPTLRGWWTGNDVTLRHKHGLIGGDAASEQKRTREHERREFMELARRAGADIPGEAEASAEAPSGLIVGLHAFLAQTPSLLAGARLADLVGEDLPTNLPGTSDAYPNWRRRLKVGVGDLAGHQLFAEVARVMRERRPRS